jgi:tetratricopeptide (TPR) repeat protein
MSRILALLLLLLLPAQACLWDRDTLQEEAKGKLDTVRAITGWFDRYPPRYYEMRLERVTKELKSAPQSLNLYDDAGVACSRLGRHDEAIAWMEKKKAVLDAMPDGGPADDRYRYLSNIGTFHLIRWITKPESVRSVELDDLKTSEGYIANALELNPDAHFGREKYQLMLIQWLLGRWGQFGDGTTANFLNLEVTLMMNPSSGYAPPAELEAAREGVSGLIQLGAAWQSIDTLRALQVCLHSQRAASLAHLAYLRQKELDGAGATSLHPDEDVRQAMKPEGWPDSFHGAEAVERFFNDARAAADKRDKAWVAYQEERFAKGIHPDTHPAFWNGWKEPVMPKMPDITVAHFAERHPALFLVALLGAVVLGFAGLMLGFRKGRRYLRS